MKIHKQSVGIDISKDTFTANICSRDKGDNLFFSEIKTFSNDTRGFNQCVRWVRKHTVPSVQTLYLMEATGVYYENLAYYFQEKESYLVHVVLPNASSAYFKSLKLKSKTDRIDAWGLAHMGLERKLVEWTPISEQMRDLKKIVRERLRMIREKNMVSNQLHAESASFKPSSVVCNRYKKRITFLEKQIN